MMLRIDPVQRAELDSIVSTAPILISDPNLVGKKLKIESSLRLVSINGVWQEVSFLGGSSVGIAALDNPNFRQYEVTLELNVSYTFYLKSSQDYSCPSFMTLDLDGQKLVVACITKPDTRVRSNPDFFHRIPFAVFQTAEGTLYKPEIDNWLLRYNLSGQTLSQVKLEKPQVSQTGVRSGFWIADFFAKTVYQSDGQSVIAAFQTAGKPTSACAAPNPLDNTKDLIWVTQWEQEKVFGFNDAGQIVFALDCGAQPTQVSVTPDGKYMVVAGSRSNHIHIYQFNEATSLFDLQVVGLNFRPFSFDWADNYDLWVTSVNTDEFAVCRVASQAIQTFKGHQDQRGIKAKTLTDGTKVVAISNSFDSTVSIYDDNGVELARHDTGIWPWHLDWVNDDLYVVTLGDGELHKVVRGQLTTVKQFDLGKRVAFGFVADASGFTVFSAYPNFPSLKGTHSQVPSPFDFVDVPVVLQSKPWQSNTVVVENFDGEVWAAVPTTHQGKIYLNAKPVIGQYCRVKWGDEVYLSWVAPAVEQELEIPFVAGQTLDWVSTKTGRVDLLPDPFWFDPVAGALPQQQYNSSTHTLSGLEPDVKVPALVDQGVDLYVNGLQVPTGSLVGNGDQLYVRAMSGTLPLSSVGYKVIVGGHECEFRITCLDAGSLYVPSADRHLHQYDNLISNPPKAIGSLVSINPKTKEFALHSLNSVPIGMKDTGLDYIWYCDYVNDKLYRFTTSGVLCQVHDMGRGSRPYASAFSRMQSKDQVQLAVTLSGISKLAIVNIQSSAYPVTLLDIPDSGEPLGVAGDSYGNIYVADRKNAKVHVYKQVNGVWRFVKSLGCEAGDKPLDVWCDSVDNVWATDLTGKLHRWTSEQRTTFNVGGRPWSIDGYSNYIYLAESYDGKVLRFNKVTEKVDFSWNTNSIPTGVRADVDGNIWVSDLSQHKVTQYSQAGLPLYEQQLSRCLISMDRDEAKNIWVASTYADAPAYGFPAAPIVLDKPVEPVVDVPVLGVGETVEYTVGNLIRPVPVFWNGYDGVGLKVNGVSVTQGSILNNGDAIQLSVVMPDVLNYDYWIDVSAGSWGQQFKFKAEPKLFPDMLVFPTVYNAIDRQDILSGVQVVKGISDSRSAELSIVQDVGESPQSLTFVVNGIEVGNTATVYNGDIVQLLIKPIDGYYGQFYQFSVVAASQICGIWKVASAWLNGPFRGERRDGYVTVEPDSAEALQIRGVASPALISVPLNNLNIVETQVSREADCNRPKIATVEGSTAQVGQDNRVTMSVAGRTSEVYRLKILESRMRSAALDFDGEGIRLILPEWLLSASGHHLGKSPTGLKNVFAGSRDYASAEPEVEHAQAHALFSMNIRQPADLLSSPIYATPFWLVYTTSKDALRSIQGRDVAKRAEADDVRLTESGEGAVDHEKHVFMDSEYRRSEFNDLLLVARYLRAESNALMLAAYYLRPAAKGVRFKPGDWSRRAPNLSRGPLPEYLRSVFRGFSGLPQSAERKFNRQFNLIPPSAMLRAVRNFIGMQQTAILARRAVLARGLEKLAMLRTLHHLTGTSSAPFRVPKRNLCLVDRAAAIPMPNTVWTWNKIRTPAEKGSYKSVVAAMQAGQALGYDQVNAAPLSDRTYLWTLPTERLGPCAEGRFYAVTGHIRGG